MTGPVYFFGCWGSTGHYLRDAQGCMIRDTATPFAHVDGVHCPGALLHRGRWETPLGEQEQGHAALLHAHGWTVLGIWDRTMDSRYGSHSTFLFDGSGEGGGYLPAPDMMALCERAYPEIWARIRSAAPVSVVDNRDDRHPSAASRACRS